MEDTQRRYTSIEQGNVLLDLFSNLVYQRSTHRKRESFREEETRFKKLSSLSFRAEQTCDQVNKYYCLKIFFLITISLIYMFM